MGHLGLCVDVKRGVHFAVHCLHKGKVQVPHSGIAYKREIFVARACKQHGFSPSVIVYVVVCKISAAGGRWRAGGGLQCKPWVYTTHTRVHVGAHTGKGREADTHTRKHTYTERQRDSDRETERVGARGKGKGEEEGK